MGRKACTYVQGHCRLHCVLWFPYCIWWWQDNRFCSHLRFLGLLEAIRTQVQISQTGFVQERKTTTKTEEREEEQNQESQGNCQSRDWYWQKVIALKKCRVYG